MDLFRQTKFSNAAMILAALFGCALSIATFNPHRERGYDEQLYVLYAERSPGPALARAYVDGMRHGAPLALPPLRVGYTGAAALLHRVSGVSMYAALALLSCGASMGALLWAAFLCRRFLPPDQAWGATLLFACAPLRLHLGSRVFIDSVFAFWTWLTVGSLLLMLHDTRRRRWPVLYALSWFMLTLTKESAIFIWIAVLPILWIHRNVDRARLRAAWGITLAAPFAAVVVLLFVAGGLSTFMDIYATFFARARNWPQAMLTGDGPWYRYAIDWVILCPVLFLLGVGGLSQLRMRDRLFASAACLWGSTFVILSCLRYGYNLRYTAIWEFPLALFAALLLASLAAKASRWGAVLFLGGVLLASAVNLFQYHDLFVRHSIYDPVPLDLLRAKKVLKYGSDIQP